MKWSALCMEDLARVLTQPALYIAAALLAGLSVTSMIQNRSDLDEHRGRYAEQLQDRVQAQLRNIAPSGRIVDPGLQVLRPPPATTILLRGTTLPAGWDFGPSGVEARPPYSPLDTRIEASVSLDFGGLVLVFGGLLSGAFGVQRILSDRDSRWSSAVRTLPVRWHEVAIARVMAGAGVVALMLGMWFAIVVVAAGFVEPASAGELRRTLFLLTTPTWLYLTTLHAAGMTVALWCRSSLRAVVIGMALWLSITFVLPQVLPVVSRTVVQGMTRPTMERERRDAHAESVAQFEDAMGRMIGEQIPEREMRSALVDIDGPAIAHLQLNATWRAGMARARKVADAFDEEWNTYENARSRFRDTSVSLSPASALTAGLSELAGVGRVAEQVWESAVQDHYLSLTAVVFDDRPQMNSKVPMGTSYSMIALNRHRPRRYPALPEFQEPAASRLAGWQAARRPVTWLLVQTILALALASLAGVRDLRRGTQPKDYGR